jgi:hypothetical protein
MKPYETMMKLMKPPRAHAAYGGEPIGRACCGGFPRGVVR